MIFIDTKVKVIECDPIFSKCASNQIDPILTSMQNFIIWLLQATMFLFTISDNDRLTYHKIKSLLSYRHISTLYWLPCKTFIIWPFFLIQKILRLSPLSKKKKYSAFNSTISLDKGQKLELLRLEPDTSTLKKKFLQAASF